MSVEGVDGLKQKLKITILYDNTAWDQNELKRICPTHCTQYISEIAAQYPENYIAGGAGKVIVL
jgi:metal-dependent hydrolase (beta-lactamase superfamily II)